jgi:poly(ribitol-phosphate) beta-N-acetylglucosaminyltransferase
MIVAVLALAVVLQAGLCVGVVALALWLRRSLNDQRQRLDFLLNTMNNVHAELASLVLAPGVVGGQVSDALVCSLTTLEGRLPFVHIAIESILLQTVRPRSVELYLSDRVSPDAIPPALDRLRTLGLTIHFVPDVGPHTKLIYALADFPDTVIVTIDDDICYPSNTLSTLLHTADRFPGTVVGNWARRLTLDRNGKVIGVRDGALLTPPSLYKAVEQAQHDGRPSARTFCYGTGAVLYPPCALDARVQNVEAFQRLCPTEDDIWFKAMALLKGTLAVHTGLGIDPAHHTVRGTQARALRHVNHVGDRNAAQMRAVFDAYDLHKIVRAAPP